MQIYKSIVLSVLLLIGAGLSLPICAADVAGYTSGKQLIKLCNEKIKADNGDAWVMCALYVEGMIEGLQGGIYLGIINNNSNSTTQELHDKFHLIWPYCAPNNVTGDEAARVVTNFITEHPNDLSNSAYTLVMGAFVNAWPCMPKK